MRDVYRQGLRFIALVGLYLAGVEFAVHFIADNGAIALFWPSSGLALAAVILYGRRWVLFIPFAITITQLWLVPAPLSFLPFSILSNTLGALAGGWLVGRMPDGFDSTIRFGFRTLAGGALFALVGAAIGVPGMVFSGMIPEATMLGAFLRWLMGDLLGVVTVTPALLIAVSHRRMKLARSVDYGSESEALAWNITLIASYLLMAWGAAAGSTYALGLTALPLAVMIWSALRFETLRTALSVLLTVTLIGAMAGLGLSGFQAPTGTLDTMILLSYLCLLAILPTILALAVQERRVATTALLLRANRDALTGLPNRTAFEVQVQRALQDPSMPQMALGYLDLDNLKLINDTASHTAGDALIVCIASVLSSRLEPGDLLAHLGADEFILLFRNCNAVMARERAASLLRAVEGKRCDFNGQQFSATASIGVAPFLADNADFSDLLSQADAACFTAKELGGNRVCIAGAQGGDVLDRTAAMHWAVRIREALEEHQFALFAQAIQPLRQTEVGGRHFEILLRMRNPRGGLPLTPDRFMPAAERFRLGVRIDREVVGMVLDWLESHPHAVEEIATCAINLSAGAMVDEGFIGFIAERLRSGRVAPRRLCFEITET
ncbi:MAG: diguanylate cyclase, partial [Dokdonella sp.]